MGTNGLFVQAPLLDDNAAREIRGWACPVFGICMAHRAELNHTTRLRKSLAFLCLIPQPELKSRSVEFLVASRKSKLSKLMHKAPQMGRVDVHLSEIASLPGMRQVAQWHDLREVEGDEE